MTDPGHTLTNGDIFQIERVAGTAAWVRRVLDADPETGQARLADHAFFYGDSKLRTVTDLAYAVTGHKGMGGTVGRRARRSSPAPSRWNGCTWP